MNDYLLGRLIFPDFPMIVGEAHVLELEALAFAERLHHFAQLRRPTHLHADMVAILSNISLRSQILFFFLIYISPFLFQGNRDRLSIVFNKYHLADDFDGDSVVGGGRGADLILLYFDHA